LPRRRRQDGCLLDPLVNISGETIGCEDPNDDHILEVAIKAKAHFVVTRDNDILHLPPSVRDHLSANGVMVVSDDAFCGFVREQFLQRGNLPVRPSANPMVVAIIVEPTQAWRSLPNADRKDWLNDRLAQANELMMTPERYCRRSDTRHSTRAIYCCFGI
jgi:hypothetical protein